MNISRDELVTILSQFNPWWRNQAPTDLPSWRRAAFNELRYWVENPPASRAILLSGARQVGKTTLLMQIIETLIKKGTPVSNILYVTFDHPLIKLAGIDKVLEAWREREPKAEGVEYLFLDEAQFIRDHGTWVKHQVDFNKDRRIIFTGSAMPLIQAGQESGVGRWHTIRLTTLSFYEYLQLKKIQLPQLPILKSLTDLFDFSTTELQNISELAAPLTGYFHDYLVRGGFPQTAQVDSVYQAQRLLREDIIDKVLKRDMTALFGVRNILELEQTFLYLCMHDGGLLDMPTLCSNLGLNKPAIQNFIRLLEAAHLIYRLQPYGYGKEILRGKSKIYLADAAIAPAVMLKGKSIIENPTALGIATETAVFNHLFARYYSKNIRFSYWRGDKDREIDLITELGELIIPFEVKYQAEVDVRELKGLFEFCRKKKSIDRAYIVTRSSRDFGLLKNIPDDIATRIMCVPASLLCYWMGQLELSKEEIKST